MKTLLKEFRDFINRGNVMAVAVAVIMGAAFTAIINALVGDFVTPLLSLLTLGVDFSSLSFTIGEGEHAAVIKYGSFIQACLNFLTVAIVIFFLVKSVNKVARLGPPDDTPTQECPYCKSTISKDAARCPRCTTILDATQVPEELR